MDETIIKIPDLRVVFNNNVGAISFPNIKEIPLERLFETYSAFGNALRNQPNIIKNKNGDILGVRKN